MNNLWNIIPSILTLVAGGGWLFDRRRHRQEVESLKADNRQKDMNLSKMYVEEFKENIADPLRREVRELRTEVNHLRNTVTQQTSTMAATDTLRQTVTLTLHDTIRETTTITIQTNETGDTTRLTTTRDREKITSRDRTADHSHHLTQTETTNNTKETTTTPIQPIKPINHKSPIRPLIISFLLGLILIPLFKLFHHLINR